MSAANVNGQAYALTVMTPILPGHEAALSSFLNALPSGDKSPLAKVAGTHFARWVIISDVVYEGSGPRDHLTCARLLFTSNLDGDLAAYLHRLRTGLGVTADRIWSHCAGYPGRRSATGFADYLLRHQLDTGLFFAAYGDKTVADVLAAVELRARLVDFVMAAQGLPPEDLQLKFSETFR